MGFIMNPGTLAASGGGATTVPGNLAVTGKFGANGATPVGKATAVSSLNASLSTGILLTETVTQLNATNKVVNELSTILKNAGLLA
jgi:hypothetical protein